MQLKLSLNISKKTVAIILLILALSGVAATFYLKQVNNNPLPSSIKNKISYKVIYPSKTSQIDPSSYKYQADQKALTFKVNTSSGKVVFTEQPAPDTLGSDTQVYYPALGIHPYAQFKVSLGQVALTKFWKSGSLKPAGQSAVLASNGTLLIANSEKSLTNAQWKNLFESLKITK